MFRVWPLNTVNSLPWPLLRSGLGLPVEKLGGCTPAEMVFRSGILRASGKCSHAHTSGSQSSSDHPRRAACRNLSCTCYGSGVASSSKCCRMQATLLQHELLQKLLSHKNRQAEESQCSNLKGLDQTTKTIFLSAG